MFRENYFTITNENDTYKKNIECYITLVYYILLQPDAPWSLRLYRVYIQKNIVRNYM